MDETIYQTSYKVRIADSDKYGILKCGALLQMLQEAATDHAAILGVDIASVAKFNLGWAISKFAIEIDRMPKWGERITVKTWPSAKERICTYREFEVFAPDGEKIISARSQWVLFDKTTRHLAKMDVLTDWPRLESNFANTLQFDPLQRPTPDASRLECCARRDEIDLNGHVNNAVYMIWATESMPEEIAATPKIIRINFMEEVMPRASVEVLCSKNDSLTAHSVVNKQTGRECARINILWQKNRV